MVGKVIAGVVIVAALAGGAYTATSLEKVGQGEIGIVYTVSDGVSDETLSPG